MLQRTLILGLLVIPSLALAADWEEIESENGVTTWRKEIEGSSMMAFRGEGEFDVPIGRVSGLMYEAEKGVTWVDMLVKVEVLERPSDTVTFLYQQYDLAWPMSDRDYVMKRTMVADEAAHTVTVHFGSVERPDRPADLCCVRAEALRTYWRFTSLSPTRTKIEVEVHTDPKGWLPAWVVNMVQKGWPRNSIEGIVARSAEKDVTPWTGVAGW